MFNVRLVYRCNPSFLLSAIKPLIKKITLITLLIVVIYCLYSLFDSRKMINSSYSIERWEDGVTYYLLGPFDGPGWGALEGTIDKIGWDENYILVWQNDDGQGSGWRVIDLKTNKLSPLIESSDLKHTPQINNIKILEAKVAWDKLNF